MTDIPAGHDYQGVAICKSDDPGWQLPDWDALTDELLPQTHLVKVDEILVAGDADPGPGRQLKAHCAPAAPHADFPNAVFVADP